VIELLQVSARIIEGASRSIGTALCVDLGAHNHDRSAQEITQPFWAIASLRE
jgi:hypothetical protein